MIKRYNFGFKFFGPLEQAEEGKFCKAEDVLDILTKKDRIIGSLTDSNKDYCDLLDSADMTISRLTIRNNFLASQVGDLTKIEENHKKLEKEIDFNRNLIRICGLAIGFLIGKIVLDNFQFISGLF